MQTFLGYDGLGQPTLIVLGLVKLGWVGSLFLFVAQTIPIYLVFKCIAGDAAFENVS